MCSLLRKVAGTFVRLGVVDIGTERWCKNREVRVTETSSPRVVQSGAEIGKSRATDVQTSVRRGGADIRESGCWKRQAFGVVQTSLRRDGGYSSALR